MVGNDRALVSVRRPPREFGVLRHEDADEEAANRAVEDAIDASAYDPHELERCEERLFALRAMGRKHNAPIESLPALAWR